MLAISAMLTGGNAGAAMAQNASDTLGIMRASGTFLKTTLGESVTLACDEKSCEGSGASGRYISAAAQATGFAKRNPKSLGSECNGPKESRRTVCRMAGTHALVALGLPTIVGDRAEVGVKLAINGAGSGRSHYEERTIVLERQGKRWLAVGWELNVIK